MSFVRFTGPQHFTYEHGFQQAVAAPKTANGVNGTNGHTSNGSNGSANGGRTPWHLAPPVPVPTSAKANSFGVFSDNTYPTLLAGTNAPDGPPAWFKKESEVDVLICGGTYIRTLNARLTRPDDCSVPNYQPVPLAWKWQYPFCGRASRSAL